MALRSHLTLPPDPLSVRRARQHVSEILVEAGRPEWVDDAALAVTEVVANVVLHAHTACELSVYVDDDKVRVSVRDYSRDLPTHQHFSAFATTGRGLSLVTRLSADFGIQALDAEHGEGGKVVWFVLDGVERDIEPDAPGDEWDLTGLDLLDDPVDESQEVLLAGVPMALWLAGLEHETAVLRELYLVAAAPSRTSGDVAVDLAAAETVLRTLSEGSVRAIEMAAAEPKLAALARSSTHPATGRLAANWNGHELLDVHVTTTAVDRSDVNAFQDALDLGQRLAGEGRLLVRPALDELVALRDWACDQMVAQAAGIPASAWDGATARPAVPVPSAYRLPHWDDTEVRTSKRAVVAADDSNRLIAVSQAAAAVLGGTPADLIGRRITTIIPPRLRDQHVAGFTRHLATGEAHVLGVELELPVLRLDGREVMRRLMIEQVTAPAGRQVYVAWLNPVPEP
jgi:PAS domain S-box-containing protein